MSNLETKRHLLKQKIKENGYERVKSSTRGDLDTSKLHLIGLDKNIFLEKIKGTGLDYNLELLVDLSGSMVNYTSGGKYNLERALQAAKDIASLLYGVVNLNVTFFNYLEETSSIRGIWSYNTDDCDSIDDYFDAFAKGIQEEVIDGKTHITKTGKPVRDSRYSSMGGTSIITSLVNASERLDNKSGKTAIVMIGDGRQNFDNHRSDADIYIGGKSVAKYNLETNPDIGKQIHRKHPTLGIGIGTDFSDYLPKSQTITSCEDIYDLVVDFFLSELSK